MTRHIAAALPIAAGIGVLLMLGSPSGPKDESAAPANAGYRQLPLAFERNRGQADRGIGFLVRGGGYTVALRPTEALFALARDDRFRMRLAGANPSARLRAQEALVGKVNYLIGKDRSRWLRGVETYGRVISTGVYPGIDVVYRGERGRLEYDFILRPGADPSQISLAFDGAGKVRIDRAGSLLLDLPGGPLRQLRPQAYQQVDGRRQEVASSFRLQGGRVAFTLGDYDRSRMLVIDPAIVYSTYLGTNADEIGRSIAVDSTGAAYITGESVLGFRPSDATEGPDLGGADVLVTKLSPGGNAVVYTTFLGGTADDFGRSIDVDGSGFAYLTGSTSSSDFPTTAGAFDPSDNPGVDAFVTKLDTAGGGPLYSTYLGGGENDSGSGMYVDDGTGSATVSGTTSSGDFPTTPGALDTSPNGIDDVFVTRFDATGPAPLVFSTYLGGSGNDSGLGVDVDDEGSSYITGYTESANFPTMGAFDTSLGGTTDAYVAKLASTGVSLVYSTYLGGGGIDQAFGVAVDPVAKTAYVVGQTASNDFSTTAGAHDTTLGGSTDAFATKLTAAGNGLAYSTYLGGGSNDRGSAVAVDEGFAYVAGETASTDFSTVSPSQPGNAGLADAFVSKFNTAGSALAYSTYLGGSGNDFGYGIAVDQTAAAYVTGRTSSSNFPTQNAAQPMYGGGADAFATKLSITTAALLRSLSARRAGANAVLRWRTGSELGLLGFNVFGERRGLRIPLNRTLISAAGGVAGHEYSFRTPSRMTRYWLQEVKVDGSRAWRGPAKVR